MRKSPSRDILSKAKYLVLSATYEGEIPRLSLS